MQILGPLPRPTSSDTVGLRPSDLCLTSYPGGADALEFASLWITRDLTSGFEYSFVTQSRGS